MITNLIPNFIRNIITASFRQCFSPNQSEEFPYAVVFNAPVPVFGVLVRPQVEAQQKHQAVAYGNNDLLSSSDHIPSLLELQPRGEEDWQQEIRCLACLI